MFGRRLKLFTIFGFEVRLDASWFFMAFLVTWSLAVGVFPRQYPGIPQSSYWWMGIIGALGLFGSIVVHELCHSLVANAYKLPMKGITLFIFGGVAEMGGEPASPKVEFLMAIAGPAASVVIGFLFFLLHRAGEGRWSTEAVGVMGYLGWINWILAAFNMLPAFPLDGGRVLRSALWQWHGDLRRATRLAARIGTGFGLLIMVFAVYQFFQGYLIGAIWYFLIGMFLQRASRASYQQVLLRSVLEGEPIQHFMKSNPVTAPPWISIRELVDEYIYRYNFRMFPVVNAKGEVTGCVSAADVKQVPREEWDRHTVQEVAKPVTEENTIEPESDALKALTKMRDNGRSGLMVTDHGHLLAIISLRDLLRLISAKVDLEGEWSGLPRHAS
jgi:Zn-dependent protease/predicted transcriptional regulator